MRNVMYHKMFRLFKKKDSSHTETGNDRKIFNTYIRNFRKNTEKLIASLSFMKLPGELLPPWIVKIYPLSIDASKMNKLGINPMTYIQKDSWYWYPDRNSGEGGDYKIDFNIFFRGLSMDKKKAYFKKYDLGNTWQEREVWFHTIFDDENISDEEYDKLFLEIIGNT